jgi:uracil phosphoribosyltransferase
MKIHNLSEKPSVLNTFISELRDTTVQKDGMRFRRNIERIGEILGYEMSKSFNYENRNIQTPLGEEDILLHNDDIVLCSILRAGIPLHNGLLNYFDRANSAFISAYRKHVNQNSKAFEIEVEYLACPDLNGKTLILADPMLATGKSILATLRALNAFGKPKKIHLVSIIGAQPGIVSVSNQLPNDVDLWIGAIDNKLNDKSYIVPGLGDAGDLAFGSKLDQ